MISLKYSKTGMSSLEVDKLAKFDYVTLTPNYHCTVGNLVNGVLQRRIITKSLQREVRNLLNYERGERVCYDKLCGTADALDGEIPVEIKTMTKLRQEVIQKAEIQATIYALLYNAPYSKVVIAIYNQVDDFTALIKKVYEYEVYPQDNIEKVLSYCEKLKLHNVLAIYSV